MALRKKILFTIGSPNQTSQMHQIASQLSDYDCYFSQLYSKHPVVRLVQRTGLLDTTILAGEFKRKGDAYLDKHQLPALGIEDENLPDGLRLSDAQRG